MSEEYWIEVLVSPEGFIGLNADEFYEWADRLGVVWGIKPIIAGARDFQRPCFLFKNEDDIIAFKLRFGL